MCPDECPTATLAHLDQLQRHRPRNPVTEGQQPLKRRDTHLHSVHACEKFVPVVMVLSSAKYTL
eukprot:6027152-Amphidinium_carterae.1